MIKESESEAKGDGREVIQTANRPSLSHNLLLATSDPRSRNFPKLYPIHMRWFPILFCMRQIA
jgi:hypothetical protein